MLTEHSAPPYGLRGVIHKLRSTRRVQVARLSASLGSLVWWVAALMDTLHITQSGVALFDTYEFHQIQIVNQYHSYYFLYRRIGERICFLLFQVSTLYVR